MLGDPIRCSVFGCHFQCAVGDADYARWGTVKGEMFCPYHLKAFESVGAVDPKTLAKEVVHFRSPAQCGAVGDVITSFQANIVTCPDCLTKSSEAAESVRQAIHRGRQQKQEEAVDHPAHYGGADDPFEAIKVIEAWDLGFHLGNAVKYVNRADRKGTPLEDLKKAAWYLARAIERREKK